MIHAIDVAITQLGVRELTGHNDGIPAERYMRGDELAWCAGFLSYCFEVSDDPDLFDDFDSSTDPTLRDQYAIRAVDVLESRLDGLGCTMGPRVLPARNDIVFYGGRAGSDHGRGRHCGILERVSRADVNGGRDPHAGFILHTVEGNLGDACRRRTVPFLDPRISGFARVTPIPSFEAGFGAPALA